MPASLIVEAIDVFKQGCFRLPHAVPNQLVHEVFTRPNSCEVFVPQNWNITRSRHLNGQHKASIGMCAEACILNR
jgi:hypothetical protein